MADHPAQASILLHFKVHNEIELEYFILSLKDNSVTPLFWSQKSNGWTFFI